MESKSKYQTGLYFKSCLYSDKNEWVYAGASSELPTGHLKAAVSINRTNLEVHISIYDRMFEEELLQQAKDQMNFGFSKMDIDDRDQEFYNVLYQTPRKTTELPIVKEYSDSLIVLRKIIRFFKRVF